MFELDKEVKRKVIELPDNKFGAAKSRSMLIEIEALMKKHRSYKTENALRAEFYSDGIQYSRFCELVELANLYDDIENGREDGTEGRTRKPL